MAKSRASKPRGKAGTGRKKSKRAIIPLRSNREEENKTRRAKKKPVGGLGGRALYKENETERGETGLTVIKEGRLLHRAIREGWIGRRWETEATQDDLIYTEQQRPLTLKEKALQAVMVDVESVDPRIRQIAVRNVVAMEGQNQTDEKGPNLHLHAHAAVDNEYLEADSEALIAAKVALARLKESVNGNGQAETGFDKAGS